MSNSVNSLLKIYEDIIQILLMLYVFFVEDLLCRTPPALKPACSSALIFSACGLNILRMIFNMALLGWLIRLTVL